MQELTGISTVKTEEVEHHLWKKAFKIYNDTVQLLVLTEVGPRILFFGFVGERRMSSTRFASIPENARIRPSEFMEAIVSGYPRRSRAHTIPTIFRLQ